MKLIWHIIRKDIARDRVALLVWAFLFLGQAGLGWVLQCLDTPERDTVTYAQIASATLVFLQAAMSYVLVARLVQADALAGTSMFWLTRPVSAGRLLAAKLLGVLLVFGLFPVLLLVPWWLSSGFGWQEIGWSAVNLLGWQLLVIAPAFLVASLTDDLGRVLLWTLLLIIWLISWIVLLQASPFARGARNLAAGALYSKLWVSAVLFIVGAFAVAIHQYLTRRRFHSIVLTGLALGVVVLGGEFFSGNWASAIGQLHRPAVPVASAAVRDGISFQVLPAEGPSANQVEKPENGPKPRDAWIHLRLLARGVPDGLQFFADEARQTWTWADGVSIARTGDFGTYYLDLHIPELRKRFALPTPVPDPETEQWRQEKRAELEARQRARGYRQPRWVPFPAEAGSLQLRGYATLPNSFVAKMRREPPRYTANFEGLLYRHDVLAEIPVATGSRAAFAGGRVRVGPTRDGHPVLVSSQPAFIRRGLWYAAEVVSSLRSGRISYPIVVMNEVTGDLAWVRDDQQGSQTVQLAGVILNWNYVSLGMRAVIRNGKDVGIQGIDPRWQEHTKLAFLAGTKVARFAGEIEVERFTLVSADEPEEGSTPATNAP